MLDMVDKDTALLTPYQLKYWKDPEKKRAQQRAKYVRYPDRIYAIARAWQKKNKEHYNKLVGFSQKIRKARLDGNEVAVRLLSQAREEYKKTWRAANRPVVDETTRFKECEAKRIRAKSRSLINYHKKKGNWDRVKELEKRRDEAIAEVLKS